MSVQGGRLGLLVSFVGVEGSFMFGDVRITGRNEGVRHVMPIQGCIFEGMYNNRRAEPSLGWGKGENRSIRRWICVAKATIGRYGMHNFDARLREEDSEF
jgi:hypothetical protein